MSYRINKFRLGCAALAISGGWGAASTAWAQSVVPEATTVAPDSEIIVTGSRIRRNALDQDAPIVFVDQADIAKTGLNSVNDVLQRLPSSGGGANSKVNNSGSLGNPPDGGGVGAGSAEIDLRYLGSRRVLVLVDGIRYVNGASASGVPGSTDLNSIPESMIERIEVLQDGASAIYGSDAIAGVVNIITKKRQAGVLASAQIGVTDYGDGSSQNYQLSWGNGSSGPLQLVVGGNYVTQDSISAGDRKVSRFPAPYSNSCADGGCSGFIPNGRFAVFGQQFTLKAPVIGRPVTQADLRPFINSGSLTDRFNFAPFNFVQIPLDRYGVFGNVRYELADNLNFSVRGLWNERKSKNQAAPLPFGVGVAAGITDVLDAIAVDATNPFNPFGVTLNSSNTEFIYRRFVEGGPRRFNQTVTTKYGVATLDGKFAGDWFWDVNAAYGINKAKQRMLGNINSSRLRQALGPLANCTAPCVPFNLFGGVGSLTPAMLDFVTFVQNDSSEQSTWDLTGNVSGSLFELPGGPLGIAAGVEYRKLSGRFDPDPVVAAGFSSDIPALPTRGSYSVKEAYAEVNAPLLADRPFFQLLEFNGAVRVSDYSTSGSTTTLKGGVNWKPVNDLRLRASYAQGFRAPSIGELFGSASRFDQQIDDPCSSHADNEAPRRFQNDTTVRANCIAAGVPSNGTYQQANPQISVLVGGDQNLSPETSRSWVVGGVLSPSFVPRLSIEANYYDIRIKSAIQAINAETTITNCVVSNDPAACGLVTRAGAGQLTVIQGLLGNIAGIETDGIDLNVAYRTGETGIGRFGLTWNNTFLRNYDVLLPAPGGGINVVSREGTEQGSPSQAFPKWKSIGILDWDGPTVGATVTGRYISSIIEPLSKDNKMGSRFYTDLQIRFFAPSFADNFGFALGVNNLFNKNPPGCISCDINNFDPTAYDASGRYYYARATVRM